MIGSCLGKIFISLNTFLEKSGFQKKKKMVTLSLLTPLGAGFTNNRDDVC